ncbi:lysine N(6)-hydroxylase/L-ornithine N(5)-oxygenase family protein [Nocardioides sp. zg-DK7169]|uniref:lysine N(6)-hydroxylase/L-ornithine N(5)-oxygenase family protein n=1 Tax=Nocardioides sp. zg-DK7169 TaxID=2736600 RepID=UPI00155529C8|nr:SidA/IucD/PvdA family monooxygenase [Nocardioides sp. zg-DK7169]NPC95603.1 SidA/IucD/PvdA family monooxygenase [Nocardioides sp. zg-DK7169]
MGTPTNAQTSERVHDFVAIGLGPFNLGLACLTDPVEDLDGVFLEARERLEWHPGMLLDDSTLQVPFLADLVTMADPTSRWSFLNHLKETGRLYPFYIRESFYPLRREYDEYCRWAAERLPSVRFGCPVTAVEHDGEAYVVRVAGGSAGSTVFRGRRLVLGVGTRPRVLDCVRDAGGPAIHSADYLGHKAELQQRRTITIVGSGQSAAEVYLDLLAESPAHSYDLLWVTRSPRFFPMEYTKLTLEMTSPEYTRYFQGLSETTRASLLREQRALYKGISGDTINAISDLHYRLRVTGDGPRTTLVTSTEVTDAAWDGTTYSLGMQHHETGERFGVETDGLVLATGYAAQVPEFLEPVRDRIAWDDRGRFRVSPTYSAGVVDGEVFVQNAEEHSHGFVAPDLGMGAYRNSVIIARMAGREVYPVEKRIAVQTFGVPDHLRTQAPTREVSA